MPAPTPKKPISPDVAAFARAATGAPLAPQPSPPAPPPTEPPVGPLLGYEVDAPFDIGLRGQVCRFSAGQFLVASGYAKDDFERMLASGAKLTPVHQR
jgi:hypothetical protein